MHALSRGQCMGGMRRERSPVAMRSSEEEEEGGLRGMRGRPWMRRAEAVQENKEIHEG